MLNFQLSDWLIGYYCDDSVGDLLVQIQDLPPTVARVAKRIWGRGVCPAVEKTKEKESYKEAKYNTSKNHSRRSRLVKDMIHKTTQNEDGAKKMDSWRMMDGREWWRQDGHLDNGHFFSERSPPATRAFAQKVTNASTSGQ